MTYEVFWRPSLARSRARETGYCRAGELGRRGPSIRVVQRTGCIAQQERHNPSGVRTTPGGGSQRTGKFQKLVLRSEDRGALQLHRRIDGAPLAQRLCDNRLEAAREARATARAVQLGGPEGELGRVRRIGAFGELAI